MSEVSGVGVLIRSLANGGAEKQSILLGKALQQRFPTYLVVLDRTPLHDKHWQKIQDEKIKTVFLEGNLFRKYKQLSDLIRKEHIQYLFSFLPSDTFLAAVAGRLNGVKAVFGGVRNAIIPKHKQKALKLLHNHLLHYSIANCHSGVKNLSQQGFKSSKFVVIHNALEHLPALRERKAHPEVRLVTVGRFVAQKNFLMALRLFRKLLDSSPLPELHYTIIGYGPLEAEIRAEIGRLALEKHVELLINPEQLEEKLWEADIYFCPSLFEGLSNAVMEAMSCALPIVASSVGDNDYLVFDGENGYIHELQDEEGMLNSIKILVSDREKRLAFGQKSREIIQQQFSFQAFSEQYLKLIEAKSVHETA
jgi:glycosyltransferase involved in cell wall biosynthesis